MSSIVAAPRRSAAVLLTAVAAVVVFVAMVLTAAPASHAATESVTIVNYAYSPASLTVHVGDTVTWTNQDTAPHTVTSSSGPAKLDSPQLEKGQSWSFTFTKAGDYEYYCAVHPDMKGKVIVLDSDTTTTAPPSTTSTTAAPSSGSGGSGDGMNMQPSPSPSPSPSPAPSDGGSSGGTSTACPGLATAMVDPFIAHFDKAHLETSPGQQAEQALNVDQYAKTHTVMFEMMLAPLFHLAEVAPNGIDPFIVHFDKAHLETSPGQQVDQAANVDQYTKTHTVLFEDMLAPVTNSLTGSGTC